MKRIQPQVLCSLASRSPAAVRVEPWGAKFEKNGRPPKARGGAGAEKKGTGGGNQDARSCRPRTGSKSHAAMGKSRW
jgi:hypothetical protein